MNTQEILAKLHISELGQMQKDASAAVLHTDRQRQDPCLSSAPRAAP